MRSGWLIWAWIVVAALPLAGVGAPVAAQTSGVTLQEHIARLKQLQQQRSMQGFERRRAALQRRAAELRRSAAGTRSRSRARPQLPELAERLREAARRAGMQRVAAPLRGAALAANQQINNRAGDSPSSGQSEVSIAALGNRLVAAWNDGEGFVQSISTQGYGISTDGGATWTDGGAPPLGGAIINWSSDPVVVVNEKSGDFYYNALCDVSGGQNGVGVIRGSFDGGGNFSWDTPRVVRAYSNTTNGLDKNWIAVDSLTGNLYVTYTNFSASGNRIDFERSTDEGVTWAGPTQLSAGSDNGRVQGARPVVGPIGEVYAVWFAIGSINNSAYGRDFMRIRRAPAGGTPFGAHITADSVFSNFGNGAPGFNRGIGVTFPGIAVDRSTGAHRGRVYLAWNESLNFYDDSLGTTTALSEVEPNGTTGQATLFTMGQIVRGTLATGTEVDWFRFSGTRGQTVILYADSMNTNTDFAFDLVCTNGTTQLAYSNSGTGSSTQALLVFTLPKDGDYYLAVTSNGDGLGKYRVQTGLDNGIPNRSRDHRDIFVAHSDNGIVWAPGVRVNEDPGYFDNWLPEVAVGYNGKPYVAWYDWRDTPASLCGGTSNVYLARSEDGGASWTPGSAVTDVGTHWTTVGTNIQPNQGDYIALFAGGGNIYAAWADGRNVDVDVFMSAINPDYTAALLSLASAQATPERVTLTWFAADPALVATVYRRRESQPWTALGTVSPDGGGLVRFADDDVVAGERYEYRLGVWRDGAEEFYGATWVEVPRAIVELAIRGVRPNPSAGEAWVTFALPRAGGATLELLDVTGRRVAAREVGGLGAGVHLVKLGDAASRAPGVYVVRLVQADRTATAKMSVVR
jgi:pre-peptidase